jgi:glycosyltransferase involved in cell wall biosynthesis
MKLCLLSDKYPPDPGGLAISAQRLARGLAAAGHTVHVSVLSQAGLPGQVSQNQQDGLTIHRLGLSRRIDDTRTDWFESVARLHRQVGFDLLHGYYLAGAGFVAVYAAGYLGLPSVVSARGNDLDRTIFNPGQAASILWALSQAGAVTTVSQELARKACALVPTCRPQVVFNGVDAEQFAPASPDLALKQELGLAVETPLIGFVGEARLKKGLAILLPAFARVARVAAKAGQPRPALLLIGGLRPDEADIWQVFKAKNPDLALYSLPYLEHKRMSAYYRLLDLAVIPSLRDGLPNALLEAMACERAVIASDVGGIPDALRHGENGLLTPPGQVEPLAEAMLELLAAPERRRELGQAARQTILNSFTPAVELARNLEIYRALVGQAEA